MIVTIDGPAGSGKSTAARGLAERLGFQFLDTGAMYRLVAWSCLKNNIDLHDAEAVGRLAEQLEIEFSGTSVFVDGREVTDLIRGPEVTEAASIVAANPKVRRAMVAQQRKLAQGRDIVTEGRDQGTIVFPDAECKFFLVADPKERARRRQAELARQGVPVSLEDVLQQIRQRDQRDETRSVAPLREPEDAVRLDTSRLTVEEMIDVLERTVRDRMR